MYLSTKISKRNVKSHAEYNKQIPKGKKYVRVSNGTIGAGARHVNIPLELVLKDFSLEEITQAYWQSRKEESSSIDYKYDTFFEDYEKEANEYASKARDFCADDIPF